MNCQQTIIQSPVSGRVDGIASQPQRSPYVLKATHRPSRGARMLMAAMTVRMLMLEPVYVSPRQLAE